MKLLILGATGRVGKEITANALSDGHLVTVLVRDPNKINDSSDRLTILQGDACSEQDVISAIQGANAVICALGTDGGSVLTDNVRLLISAMRKYAVKRVITIGTAGILDSREHPGLLRYEAPDSRRTSTRAAEEHRKAWELLSGSGLEWTIVCPTYLPLGERTGIYRIEQNRLPDGGMSISVSDTADFAYRQLQSAEHVGKRVGIAY
ncbi:NAD(P)-dependent oxidoreductase [Cohnella cholangitidis]|uniref:SDR family oxidoreductase n=1 Tax=Cohnella cholangitidis TaxID=2598458 RepID=A0A7G5BVH2_9BACL|nr:SDR family oxidoreductase [Cohnella cholangitidis]QMV40956.1 SDR family oxidoreductase [Cohnella cholangitidis]